MNDQWTNRLSEYLDETLTGTERMAADAHLATCPACRAVVDDLRRVRARARALDERPPATDLWPRIAREIGLEPARTPVIALAPRRPARALALSLPQLLAASVALMVISGGAAWLAARRAGARHAAAVTSAARFAWANDPRYGAAIAQLQAALDEGRTSGRLDTATVRMLEHNLAVVDTAIAQARRALEADPGSMYLNHHLVDTMRQKLDLLREAAALVSAQT